MVDSADRESLSVNCANDQVSKTAVTAHTTNDTLNESSRPRSLLHNDDDNDDDDDDDQNNESVIATKELYGFLGMC